MNNYTEYKGYTALLLCGSIVLCSGTINTGQRRGRFQAALQQKYSPHAKQARLRPPQRQAQPGVPGARGRQHSRTVPAVRQAMPQVFQPAAAQAQVQQATAYRPPILNPSMRPYIEGRPVQRPAAQARAGRARQVAAQQAAVQRVARAHAAVQQNLVQAAAQAQPGAIYHPPVLNPSMHPYMEGRPVQRRAAQANPPAQNCASGACKRRRR